MDISNHIEADWIPKEHRLIYNFSEANFWGPLILSLFFICLTPLGFIFTTETDNLTPLIASLMLAVGLALTALGANKQRGFKTVLNQDGICSYHRANVVHVVKYHEIAYMELSNRMPDKDSYYHSYVVGAEVRMRQKTIDLYNDKNELITRLTLEPTFELGLVLLMLIKYNPNLKNHLSITEEKAIEAYLENREKQHEKFKK